MSFFRYAGVLLGIVNVFCTLPGWISPIVVSYLTFENQTTESWKIVFIITGSLLILGGIIYLFFADSSQQPWNDYNSISCKNQGEEMSVLKKNTLNQKDSANSI